MSEGGQFLLSLDTVSRLEGGRWLELGIHGAEQTVRAEPFESIDLSLGPWWEGIAE